jgi:hypothetical protein
MPTEWKSQTGNGKFCIQFETSNYDYYKLVEKACQKAVDLKDKAVMKERASTCSVLGHL